MISVNNINLIVLFSLVAYFPWKVVSAETSVTASVKSIGIVGVVYCRSCKPTPGGSPEGFTFTETAGPINNVTPLTGATVLFECDNGYGNKKNATSTTLVCGTFSIKWEDVGGFNRNNCKLYLLESKRPDCSHPAYPKDSSGVPVSFLTMFGDMEVNSAGVLLFDHFAQDDVCKNLPVGN